MTECAEGCGACCDPVWLTYPQSRAQLVIDDCPEDLCWVLEDLTQIKAEDALPRAPWLKKLAFAAKATGQRLYYFRCRHFDPDTKQCGNYANRPPTCRNYPWRGQPPDRRQLLPPTCSYRADVGQTVQVVELGRKP